MKKTNQKRLTSRGMVMINFEIEPEYDLRLNELAKRQTAAKAVC